MWKFIDTYVLWPKNIGIVNNQPRTQELKIEMKVIRSKHFKIIDEISIKLATREI